MRSWLAAAASLLILDLLWLGWLGRPIYEAAIGELLRPQALRGPALLFYLFYVTCLWRYAILGAQNSKLAFRRGAELGALAYGVYELTNWAVLEGWPGYLVPIDWAWGIFLTSVSAGIGYWVQERSR